MNLLPKNDERITIIGRTGSGKSHYALYHLALRNLRNFKWLIINTKGSSMLYDIPKVRPISFNDNFLNTKNGVYIIEPLPNEYEEELLNKLFFKIWSVGNCGLFIDEAMDIGHLENYKLILRQGREKQIPVIQCIQRPSDRTLNRHVISESEYYQVFYLNDKRDRKVVENFTTIKDEDFNDLEISRESYYFIVKTNELFKLEPAPDIDTIYSIFERKLKEKPNIL